MVGGGHIKRGQDHPNSVCTAARRAAQTLALVRAAAAGAEGVLTPTHRGRGWGGCRGEAYVTRLCSAGASGAAHLSTGGTSENERQRVTGSGAAAPARWCLHTAEQRSTAQRGTGRDGTGLDWMGREGMRRLIRACGGSVRARQPRPNTAVCLSIR